MAFTLPKNYRNLSQEEKADWNNVKKIFKSIAVNFKVSKVASPTLSSFENFNEQNNLKLLQSYKIQKDDNQFTLCLIEYNTSHQEARQYGGTIRTNSHKYVFGLVRTNNDFGNAFMRPETIGDKVSEFFSPTELDVKGFDKFNQNYYLLASDKKKFLTAMNGQLLNSIAELKNIQMEFVGRKCLFRLKKSIDLNETMDLCKLGISMAALTKK